MAMPDRQGRSVFTYSTIPSMKSKQNKHFVYSFFIELFHRVAYNANVNEFYYMKERRCQA